MAIVMASLHLHYSVTIHLGTTGSQPYSVVKGKEPAGRLTTCWGKRTLMLPSLGTWRLSWMRKAMMLT